MDDPIDELYATFNKIKENQITGNVTENSKLLDKILAGAAAGASSGSKRLAAQFICRLFTSLSPGQQKVAYNALIDLVEEDDAQTRKQVICGLPRLCQATAGGDVDVTSGCHVSKVADVLVQLLQTDDELELSLVQQSLLQVLNSNALEAIDGIFGQISHDDVPELARLRAVRFLGERLLSVDRGQMTPRVEEAIVARVDRALEDVSEEEFGHFVRVLSSLQCMQTLGGRQRLVDMVCAQADFSAAFDPGDPASVAKVRGCARQALPFLSRNIIAEKFVTYFLDQVLPELTRVPEVADEGRDRPRLDLLKLFAELSGHAGPNFSPTDEQFAVLLACVNSEMPLPPSHADYASSDGDAGSGGQDQEVDLNFSEAECLLLALHQVGRARPDYFASRPSDLTQLRKRLQQFQLANQSYQKSLKSALESKQSSQQPQQSAAAASDSATRAARLSALATTASVGRLIREFFKNPPAYLPADEAAPSWRRHRGGAPLPTRALPVSPSPASMSAAAAAAAAGAGADTSEGDASASRKRRTVDLPAYRPPAGKYSRAGGAMMKPPPPPPSAMRSSTSSAGYGGRSRYYNVYTSGGTAGGSGSGWRRH